MHRSLILLSLVPVSFACTSVGGSGDSFMEEGGTGETISATGITVGTDGSADGMDSLDDDAADEAIFDVYNEDNTGDPSDTGKGGIGGCRMSEVYGAAGGYPHFDDPAYASFLEKQVVVMTSYSYTQNEYELRVIDISGDPPAPNMNYMAPIYSHSTWTAANFGGGLFGLTLDSEGNIYVATSTVYGMNSTPGTIYKIDGGTAQISTFATIPNSGPAFGNINYDCVSETLRVVSHEDCRIWQLDMNGQVVSTYHHGTGDVSIGSPADPGEPDGQFCPLGERMWAVQSHYGRLYYSVWWEDSGRQNANQDNEIWSVAYADEAGIPDPATKQLEAHIPPLQGNSYSNPVSDISFAASGWMLAAERSMYADNSTSAHQSTTYELQQMDGMWQVVGTTYVVGELPNSSAGGVDHDFDPDGYVWMSGDALDFYTPDVVYGIQGTPYGGGTIENSTLIDHDGEVTQQDKTALGDIEIPIPGDAEPPPPPPQG